MKTYAGDRTIDGVQVSVDGRPLDARTDVKEFSRNGFEWSYEGPEPMQLAFALIADHLGDVHEAQAAAPAFMRSIVANFGNEWEITSADIHAVLASLGVARNKPPPT